MLPPFPVIVGPTASGKSALAVSLALELDSRGTGGRGPAEIVSADSMQVYKGMDIGTAKPDPAERRGVPHHLIDLVEPTESFSVERWLAEARPILAGLRDAGRLPIVVGGTNFYVRALIEGIFEGPGADAELRARLGAAPASELRAELERVDPAAAARIHPNDLRRTIRALEVFRLTGTPISALQVQWDRPAASADVQLIGLTWDPAALNRRINARVKQMIERGLVEEAHQLWSSGALGPQAREALGYKQLAAHFRGECALEDAIEAIKIETRRFAKNQRTWLNRMRLTPGSVWFAGDDPALVTKAADAVERNRACN
ncbi:MAG: tRNA (adenosine(37)-N6)-dimethylallyltransferase MiaA [Planctomycetota bacterium]|nr:tRNA (adenosine(37)-N6)-dimethylallyltransferase MiaA [Planctomycetota bacterium]